MNKHKTKFIFECTAVKEMTEFNEKYNKSLEDWCEQTPKFKPTLGCHNYGGKEGLPCMFLKTHIYK